MSVIHEKTDTKHSKVDSLPFLFESTWCQSVSSVFLWLLRLKPKENWTGGIQSECLDEENTDF